MDLPVQNLQQLRSFSGNDDLTTRNRCRRKQRRCPLVGIRIQIQTRRSKTAAEIRRSTSTSTRLANVVRGPWELPAESVVRQFLCSSFAGLSRSSKITRTQSLSEQPATLHPRRRLRVSLHRFRIAAEDW